MKNGSPKIDAESPGSIRRHVWVALLLSLLALGLGQLYTGRIWWVLGLVGSWFVLLVMFQTEIPSMFVGFVLVGVGLIAVQVAAVVHAGVSAWRNPQIARQPFHRWYVYLLYVVAFGLAMPADEQEFRALFGAYHPFRAVSGSMQPTLQPGDYFMVQTDKDAAVDQFVGMPVAYQSPAVDGTMYIHRLTATGGDKIAVNGKSVLINGKQLAKTELCRTEPTDSGLGTTLLLESNKGRNYAIEHVNFEGSLEPVEHEVPEGFFFVLGDARDNSNDSRSHGPVSNALFVGRALYIFWSNDWRRIGRSLSDDAPVAADDVCREVKRP